jgi:hypothetical protein
MMDVCTIYSPNTCSPSRFMTLYDAPIVYYTGYDIQLDVNRYASSL